MVLWTLCESIIIDGTLPLSILHTSFLSIPSFLSCDLALLVPIISDMDPQCCRGWLCPKDTHHSNQCGDVALTVSKHMCSEPINGSQEGSWKFLDNSPYDLQILFKKKKCTLLSFERRPTAKLELWATGPSLVLSTSTLIHHWSSFIL